MKIRMGSFDSWPVWAQMFVIITGLFVAISAGQMFYHHPFRTYASDFIAGALMGASFCLSFNAAMRDQQVLRLIIPGSVVLMSDIFLAVSFPEENYIGFLIGQMTTGCPGAIWVLAKNWHAGD